VSARVPTDIPTGVPGCMPSGIDADSVALTLLDVAGARGSLPARLFRPPQQDADCLVVFFPSGGFTEDQLECVDAFARALAAESQIAVLASAYTLATEAPFPAAAEDAHAVLAWATKHRAQFGWNGSHLIVAGVEAGGNLAAVAALMARDRGGPPVAAQLLIMPMLDPNLSTCSMREMSSDSGVVETVSSCVQGYRGYLPRAIDRAHPYASPLNSSRMSRLPPALILTADEDPLRDEAEAYGAKLAKAGIRASVKRLPPLALSEPNARCDSVRQQNVLHEIRQFFSELCAEASSASTPTS